MPITNPEYVAQYREIHATTRYGADCHKLFHLHVLACIVDLKPKSILEFGCGQSQLYQTLDLEGIEYHRYDPAIPEIAELKVKQADFIINTDVMEHILTADVEDVLSTLAGISNCVFFNLATRPAGKVLKNGENAHCTVWSAKKWLQEIRKHFPDANLQTEVHPGSCNILTWKSKVNPLIEALERQRVEAKKRAKAQKKPDHLLKKVERSVRKVRNKIIGKK